MLLAIETSCDETAVAVLDTGAFLAGKPPAEFLRADLVSSQAKFHEPYGGVVPELAAREHVKNLPMMISRALADAAIEDRDISTVAVTQGPGLKGSLLVGVSFAKAYALALKRPLLALHHLEGHLLAGELLEPADRPEYPALALLVSGGHTLLVLMRGFRDYELLARTRDDAAGEAFDKIASLLGLPYPGGPALSRAAVGGDSKRFPLPVPLAADPESFSFSGLKTAVMKVVRGLGAPPLDAETVRDLAAAGEQTIVKTLVQKSLQGVERHKPRSFLLTGGVAANRVLRTELEKDLTKKGVKYCVPAARWCTDNGAMMAVLAARVIEKNRGAFQAWDESSRRDPALLGPAAAIDLGAKPRWPLGELA